LAIGAVNAVFQISPYNFATTGDTGSIFDTELERKAFQTK
jgi:hypothetical protein